MESKETLKIHGREEDLQLITKEAEDQIDKVANKAVGCLVEAKNRVKVEEVLKEVKEIKTGLLEDKVIMITQEWTLVIKDNLNSLRELLEQRMLKL